MQTRGKNNEKQAKKHYNKDCMAARRNENALTQTCNQERQQKRREKTRKAKKDCPGFTTHPKV